jgi:hypothetical protein
MGADRVLGSDRGADVALFGQGQPIDLGKAAAVVGEPVAVEVRALAQVGELLAVGGVVEL